MRARDARAILFCALTAVAVAAVSYLMLHNYLVSAALTGATLALLLTRPRMLRVFRRLRGEPDWSGYFRND